MTPLQVPEGESERWTVCVNDTHRSDGDISRGVCPDCSEPFIEVVPVSRADSLAEALADLILASEAHDQPLGLTRARSALASYRDSA